MVSGLWCLLSIGPFPIVPDEYADPEMGSGAVKVTPCHDPNDYAIGERHDLEQIQVIGFDGIMTEEAGRFAGLDRYACRKQLIAELDEAGLLVEVADHPHAVPHHDKCGTVIEPLPMEQWFMNMEALAQKTRSILTSGQISYVPDRFNAYAIEWLDNIRDWALSRRYGGGIAFRRGTVWNVAAMALFRWGTRSRKGLCRGELSRFRSGWCEASRARAEAGGVS